MKTIEGKFNSAKVFTDVVDDICEKQIEELLDQEAFKDAKIRIMPDCHVGKSCVVGFTANLGDKVIPNIVGVDIGCGMYTVELGQVDIDLPRFDSIVNEHIPHGRNVHQGRLMRFNQLKDLTCYRELKDAKKMERSLGSLGGGNHFIEIDTDEEGNKYLVIHTGSRKLGQEVCNIHQKIAWNLQIGKEELWEAERKLIDAYKAEGKRDEINEAVKELHRNFKSKKPEIPEELSYLYGRYTEDYLHDMKICQMFADENRKMIARILIEKYGFNPIGELTTVHNYIDHDTNIIRKGAVSAKKGERLLIPINMRDGSLLCTGKGNDDWNQSAPHGAGRLYSRKAAANIFTVEEYQRTMDDAGVYSSSINEKTLDESPMAYKGMKDIITHIGETVDINKTIKPIYNFKSYYMG